VARTLLTAAIGALLIAGCGGEDDADTRAQAPPPQAQTTESDNVGTEAAKAKPRGTTVKVVNSEQFGPVVADRRGEALYLFDKEKTRKAECYGECATAWPPMLTKAKPKAGKGARKSLLGTTKRKDGKLQVTYRGHPLYYYEHDEPGRILCHNVPEFGGLWLVVRPNGNAAPA
jgi:predicted lipoprotein with Yx(FWY)xxD motif